MKTRRDRAWRRSQRACRSARRANSARPPVKSTGHFSKIRPVPCYGKTYPAEKCWKQMYLRSAKLVRAKKLGFVYPRRVEVAGEHSFRL